MSGSAASLPTPRAFDGALRLASDDRLLRMAAAGNQRAFVMLYERHHQALYRYTRSIVRHDQDAQDVVQTTMLRTLSALRRGAPDAPARPWLFRIAHNEAISALRRRRPSDDIETARGLAGPGLEAAVGDRERLAVLMADLQELPERQRGALVMRELSGLSHVEIAAALELSVDGAKQAIFDARTTLQEFAKGREMDCADVQRVISERDGRKLRGRPLRAHLRGCRACSALRDAIGARQADLVALAPPLPATVAAGLLANILGGGGTGAGGLFSAVTGKAAAGGLIAKAVAGAAIAATVGVGATQVAAPSKPSPAEPRTAPARAVPARAPSGVGAVTLPAVAAEEEQGDAGGRARAERASDRARRRSRRAAAKPGKAEPDKAASPAAPGQAKGKAMPPGQAKDKPTPRGQAKDKAKARAKAPRPKAVNVKPVRPVKPVATPRPRVKPVPRPKATPVPTAAPVLPEAVAEATPASKRN